MQEKRTEQGRRAKNDYIAKYTQEKYDKIVITAPKGTKQEWREKADERNMSVSQMAIKAVEEFTKE